MPVNAAFLQARAAEQANRLVAHLPHPPALRLPLRVTGFWRRAWLLLRYRGRVVRLPSGVLALVVPIVHFTNRHRLELGWASNALLTSRAPLLGDIQRFLWRLHPWFIRPDGELPNQRRPGGVPVFAGLLARRRSARELRGIIRLGRLVDLPSAELVLRRHLCAVEQDRQAGGESRLGRVAPEPNFFDNLIGHCARAWGMGRDEALDTPATRLYQRARDELLCSPGGHMEVFAPSDELLAPRSDLPAPSFSS
jgi:hypothetical protein